MHDRPEGAATRHRGRRLATVLLGAGIAVVVMSFLDAPDASAQTFGSRWLRRGDSGPDVKELQIRVAGWYDNCAAGASCYDHFHLDGRFGPKTERAVKNWEAAHGYNPDGVVGDTAHAKLRSLEDSDRSTNHFTWGEFVEKSQSCSTSNSGTFNGGAVSASTVKENVRRLMWRLESVRFKMEDRYPIYISSGFRSRAYQECLRRQTSAAAKDSQHSYGTAADNVMSGINLGRSRGLAKTSELHGIFCYGSSGFNHFDIRLDNPASSGGGRFAWPGVNSDGKDLDYRGRVCHGGHKSPPSTGVKSPAVGLPLPDPWGLAEDPFAPSDTEGAFYRDTSEEVWLIEDQDNLAEIAGAVCACIPETHTDGG